MSTFAVLAEACRQVGLDAAGAELLHDSENTIYRLPGHIVARVSRPGQAETAAKEIRVARWLADSGVRVVEPISNVAQPVQVEHRAVTFWRELAEYRFSSHVELAAVLRALHRLPAPPFPLPAVDPFVRLDERIADARHLGDADRRWLQERVTETRNAYANLPAGLPYGPVHGDSWPGNVLVVNGGPVLLDLERFAFGPPEWDLSGEAVDHTTFGYLNAREWQEFCDTYGSDVTQWSGFHVLRDARELRKVTFAFQLANQRPAIAEQAAFRLACIRGHAGPRPWMWTGLP